MQVSFLPLKVVVRFLSVAVPFLAVGLPLFPKTRDQLPLAFLYSSTFPGYLSGAVPLADGGYLVSGAEMENWSVWNRWALRVDSSGAVVWQEAFPAVHGGPSSVENVVLLDQGLVFLTGNIYTDRKNSSQDADVACLSNEGEVTWEKEFLFAPRGCGLYTSVLNDDGTVTLGGTIAPSSATAGPYPWLVVLQTDGKIRKQVCLKGRGYGVVTSLLKTNDGSLMAGGFRFYPGEAEVSFLAKLDSKYQIQWQLLYDVPRPSYASAKDGCFIVTGNTSSSPGGPRNLVALLDQDGHIIWQTEIAGDDTISVRRVFHLADDSHLVLGLISPSQFQTRPWIIKLDSAGAICWQRRYGFSSDGFDEFFDVLEASDGSLVVSGQIGTSGFLGTATLLKLTPEGLVEGDCSFVNDTSFFLKENSEGEKQHSCLSKPTNAHGTLITTAPFQTAAQATPLCP